MEEKEKKIPTEGYSFDEVIYMLQRYKRDGKKAWCIYDGNVLKSDDVSLDDDAVIEAYKKYYNYDAEKKIENNKEFEDKISDRRSRIDPDDLNRINRVKEVRDQNRDKDGNVKIITKEDIVGGLKYIAEHKELSQDELVDGLIEKNCFFTFKDVQKQFHDKVLFNDGFRQGKLSVGAYIIVNMRDSEDGKVMGMNKFFSDDSDSSVYFYIRTITNDPTYTKEYADSLNPSTPGKSY